MSELIWAIDIGGTTTRVGVVGRNGVVTLARAFESPAHGSIAEYSRRLASTANELREALTNTGSSAQLNGSVCGVAVPGIVDVASTSMMRAVNLPVLEGVSIREFVAEALGVRNVVVRNDVGCAGLAQWKAARPAYPDATRFAYLSIGTGVAACVILDGVVVSHTRGGPGHIGHMVVDSSADAPRCRCGGRGCLEALVGGWASPKTGVAVGTYDAARRSAALAIGIANLASIYAPDLILLGGGVVDHDTHLVDDARREFESRRTDVMSSGLVVATAMIKSDMAGLIGAALTCIRNLS